MVKGQGRMRPSRFPAGKGRNMLTKRQRHLRALTALIIFIELVVVMMAVSRGAG